MSRTTKLLAFLCALVLAGVTARLLPHAANFVPVTALALLAAAYLPRKMALFVPLSIMVISDLAIGMHPLVMYTWGSFVLIGYLGSVVYKRNHKRWHVGLLGPVGAVIFFVVTNFGVWVQGHIYTHTLAGLQQCFVMAVPFFRATLLSDALYTPLLFIAAHLALKSIHTLHVRQAAPSLA